ncbi:MAG: DUF5665 domain-containing protein [Paracoccaceae bacterium]
MSDLNPQEKTVRHVTAEEIITSLDSLTDEVRLLNGHRFVKLHNSVPRLVFFQFMRGLAFGLGSVVGATALVSILAFWLSQIEFLPVVGNWATQIAEMIRVGLQ